jgi:sugar-specific transcriptional regulator TrmB
VCNLGVATAKTVSVILGVKRSEAVSALSELERMGYLMKLGKTPTVYICVRRYRETIAKALCDMLSRTQVISVSEVMETAGVRNRPLASAVIKRILGPYIEDVRRSKGKKKIIVSEKAYREICLSVS